MINLIVARSSNNVIGNNNELIWHLPSDLKRFKQLTTNNSIIMGRKTYESIGKNLPNRKNIILTKSNYNFPSVKVNNIEDSIKEANIGNIFVIGGSQIYKQFIDKNLIDRIYMTQIHSEFKGDSVFIFNEDDFDIIEKIDMEENNIKFSYITYEKKNKKLDFLSKQAQDLNLGY